MKKNYANIICIKWGDRYSSNDVNILYRMAQRSLDKFSLRFYCFTDNKVGLDQNIITKDIPKINLPKKEIKYVYQKEVGLCADDLGGLNKQRVLFLDLDVVIVGKLDDFFIFPKGDEFVIINDWNSRGNRIGQASCYSWQVGSLGYIKEDFEQNHRAVIAKYFTASQEYLSDMVTKKNGPLKFWPKGWCCSFKKHCLPIWCLRYFITPKMPKNKDLKIIAFHGEPKAVNAINGIWQDFPMVYWKRIYKHLKPCPWLKKYWY
jgi:hypothetical protein